MTAATPTVLVGGRVRTMDSAVGEVGVVLLDRGRVAAVGERGILDAHPDAQQVDVTGSTVLPGFVDAHNHLSLAALQPRYADLAEATTVAEVQERLTHHADRETATEWVRGTRWEDHEAVPLTRHDLDELGLDRPVLVTHFSIHQAVVCSRGLERLGITAATPDPPGGQIERDAAGTPTGGLRERAWSRAQAAALAGEADPDRWDDLIVDRMHQLLARGVTAVHDAACPPAAEDAYRRLRDAGLLALSVQVLPHGAALLAGPDRVRLDGPAAGSGDEHLRVGAVKLFADGGSHPHIDALADGEPVREGYPFPTVDDDAAAAVARGFDVATHAMGNAGLARAIAAYRQLRADGHGGRLRVEHATLATSDQVAELADLDVAVVVQPGFVETLGRRAGGLRFDDASWMPFADLAGTDVTFAASSDHPCAPADPLGTSRLASPTGAPDGLVDGSHQPLPVDVWLHAWTLGAATAGGQQDERGSLTPGKRADLVVVDGRPGDADARVAQTWVAGEKVHDATA